MPGGGDTNLGDAELIFQQSINTGEGHCDREDVCHELGYFMSLVYRCFVVICIAAQYEQICALLHSLSLTAL